MSHAYSNIAAFQEKKIKQKKDIPRQDHTLLATLDGRSACYYSMDWNIRASIKGE